MQAGAARGQLARCLVFAGPQGTGRRTSALALAKWLHCETKPAPISFCGECRACRLIEQDMYSDVLRLRPPLFTRRDHPWLVWESHRKAESAPKDSLQVSIVQARNMRADAAVAPAEGACKIYVIEGADAMQLEANDTLLKVLEEPPSYAYFCLIAESPAALRPTILSRARVVRFFSLPEEVVQRLVREEAPEAAERAEEIAGYAGGSPGGALQMAREPGLLAIADEAREILGRALSGDQLMALRDAARMRAMAAEWFRLRYQPSAEGEEGAEEELDGEEVPPAAAGGKRRKMPSAAVRLGAIQMVDLLGNVLRAALRRGPLGGTIRALGADGNSAMACAFTILSESRAALEANANLASCLSAMLLRVAGMALEHQAASE